jgi:rubrerythrin
MKSLKGSKTEQNLLKAFAGESQARMRYDYFAKQARKEGLEQIAALFEETSINERSHAKQFFNFLEGGPVEITATYPAGKIGTTLENLKAAALPRLMSAMSLKLPPQFWKAGRTFYISSSHPG